MTFDEEISAPEQLRALYKAPSERANKKVIDRIDDICRRFIAACPYVIVASRGADGRLDVSPKGDPPGFVAVLDEWTLAIPDRLGNNRLGCPATWRSRSTRSRRGRASGEPPPADSCLHRPFGRCGAPGLASGGRIR
jgi:predicted pyridoxine 5'-phosphate oxidase superfamily flavin-nucleotide-binding protein